MSLPSRVGSDRLSRILVGAALRRLSLRSCDRCRMGSLPCAAATLSTERTLRPIPTRAAGWVLTSERGEGRQVLDVALLAPPGRSPPVVSEVGEALFGVC